MIHTIVDLTTIIPLYEIFLYKILQIPPTVPVLPHSKVDNYTRIFLQQVAVGLDNPSAFISNINQHNTLENILSSDLFVFTQNVNELKGLMLHTLNHLILSISYNSDYIYLVETITRDYMVISTHQIDKESDLLVYS